MSDDTIVQERLSELKARVLYQSERADVFLINRSAFSELFDRKRESLGWALLKELREQSPAVRLWANADHDASRQLGSPELATSERALWFVPPDVELKNILETNSDVGWALFFCNNLYRPSMIPTAIATEPSQLEKLTYEMNSRAIVVSWYDDTEWLVVLAKTL